MAQPDAHFSRPWGGKHGDLICSCSKPLFLQRGKMCEHQWESQLSYMLPIMGMSVFCPFRCFWTAPELGVVFLRFLLCPALFFECKKECRPGFCTPPPHYIHSVWNHCSGPKNLGTKGRKRTLVAGSQSF